MRDETEIHLKGTGRFFTGLLAAVLTLGVLTQWSFLFVVLLVVIVPALLIGWGIGSILYVRDGLRLALEPGPVWVRATQGMFAPIMAAAALVLSPMVLWAGRNLGTTAQLLVSQATYSLIIAEAQNGMHDEGYQEAYGTTFMVDKGPPVRVAFEPEGLLDNWSGIIFDPTGAVMTADGFDPITGKFAAPDEVTKLFGGDLVACRWMWGDYYSCSFT